MRTRAADSLTRQPGSFYATRISAYLDWIRSIVTSSATGSGVVLEEASDLFGAYVPVTDAVVDAASGKDHRARPGRHTILPSSGRASACDHRDGGVRRNDCHLVPAPSIESVRFGCLPVHSRLARLCPRRVMNSKPLFAIVFCAWFALPSLFSATNNDWPEWRGPTRDGIAAPGQNPPVTWSNTEGVLWKAALPGRGHGSPAVVGERVYLATADEAKRSQSVLCLDRNTGKKLWLTDVHAGGADAGKHANSSAASSTIACDGERLFINFLNDGAVQTTALNLDGKILWQQKICDYVTHQGFGSSPAIHESLVLVSADHRGGGVVGALERESGRIVWTQRGQRYRITPPLPY